ncbi:Type 1 glutamine amidotransferase-like domain-containing protein [Shewanella sp. KT0246]|uniref:Type 1 glutamine amidotransferase-like domain-containing protein n=1 Tax=Shewanella sp. KT0246 TaxID=2815912 RepID=UPI001BBFD0E6|nr:Type 1 glutamine amidotransferase-like domain-containing protein [Shewanella sp. KT0246]GIU48215.1 hypothetical protein TUM4249_02920 [Shewanella sp. KT0246]
MNLVLLNSTDSHVAEAAISHLIKHMPNDFHQQPVVYLASEPDPHGEYFAPIKKMYQALGFEEVIYLELEQGFEPSTSTALKQSSLVHLSGGDTYRFLHWLKHRGVDKVLRYLADEGKPIVGVSAGAMIMTPSIDSAVLCGDENNVGLIDTKGLNLVSYCIVPHVTKPIVTKPIVTNSTVTNSTGASPIKDLTTFELFQLSSEHELLLLSDNDAVTVLGNKQQFFGEPQLLRTNSN